MFVTVKRIVLRFSVYLSREFARKNIDAVDIDISHDGRSILTPCDNGEYLLKDAGHDQLVIYSAPLCRQFEQIGVALLFVTYDGVFNRYILTPISVDNEDGIIKYYDESISKKIPLYTGFWLNNNIARTVVKTVLERNGHQLADAVTVCSYKWFINNGMKGLVKHYNDSPHKLFASLFPEYFDEKNCKWRIKSKTRNYSQKDAYWRKRNAGLCVYLGCKELTDGGILCAKHRLQINADRKRRYLQSKNKHS